MAEWGWELLVVGCWLLVISGWRKENRGSCQLPVAGGWRKKERHRSSRTIVRDFDQTTTLPVKLFTARKPNCGEMG